MLYAYVPGIAGGAVLGRALAGFQAFSITKLRIAKLLSPKLKLWESLTYFLFSKVWFNTPFSRRR